MAQGSEEGTQERGVQGRGDGMKEMTVTCSQENRNGEG
jgi:hypothetical protein